MLASTNEIGVNDGDSRGRTALHLAASQGHAELVRWLASAAPEPQPPKPQSPKLQSPKLQFCKLQPPKP